MDFQYRLCYAAFGLMVLLGGIPSIYILVSMPIILAEKFYGKIKYGKSLYD